MKKESLKPICAILIIFLTVAVVLIIRNTEFGKDFAGEAYRYTIQPIKKIFVDQEKLTKPTTTISRTKKYLCTDTDNGIDFLTKGTVNSLKYLSGKEDYCYTFPNGKTYLMEGICDNNEYAYVQKNCAELGENYVCNEGVCIPYELLYDEDGRLTDYARSLAPPMLTLDLDALPKLHPEDYGNNYFEPGTYNVHVGDGFGKGDFLIKFVEFNTDETLIYFEVFKKESDDNYYPYPTQLKVFGYFPSMQLFDIVIEFPSSDAGMSADENILIYHPECNIFFDYCYDESSNYFIDYGNEYSLCSNRCPFNALPNEETKVQSSIYSVIFHQGYNDLALFFLEDLEQCYNNEIAFLKYDPQLLRLGLKIFLGGNNGPSADDEVIHGSRSEMWLIDHSENLQNMINEKSIKKCPSYLALGHEITHILTPESFKQNVGLFEGLAEFVAFQLGRDISYYECSDTGWKLNPNEEIKEYASLSYGYDDEYWDYPMYYYATGFCFWQDLTLTYGYPKFVEIMQQLYQKSRGIDDYYALDVIEEVIGGPLSQEIMDRYSLTKEATFVEICHNCEMFITE